MEYEEDSGYSNRILVPDAPEFTFESGETDRYVDDHRRKETDEREDFQKERDGGHDYRDIK